jgi:hypothetical protein
MSVMSSEHYTLLVAGVGTLLQYAKAGSAVTVNHPVRPELASTIELSATTDRDPPGLSTRETLALAVLASNDRAAAAALADYLLEEGLDWAKAEIERLAEPIKEAAVKQERERARHAAAEFLHRYERNVGDGYGRHFRGDAASRAFVMETLARLNEQADFVESGETLNEWEANKRAEFRLAMLRAEYERRFFDGSRLIRESAGVLEVNDGHAEIEGNNRSWYLPSVYDEVAALTPEQADFVTLPDPTS